MLYKNREKIDNILKGAVFWAIGLDSYWIKDSKPVFVMIGTTLESEI